MGVLGIRVQKILHPAPLLSQLYCRQVTYGLQPYCERHFSRHLNINIYKRWHSILEVDLPFIFIPANTPIYSLLLTLFPALLPIGNLSRYSPDFIVIRLNCFPVPVICPDCRIQYAMLLPCNPTQTTPPDVLCVTCNVQAHVQVSQLNWKLMKLRRSKFLSSWSATIPLRAASLSKHCAFGIVGRAGFSVEHGGKKLC